MRSSLLLAILVLSAAPAGAGRPRRELVERILAVVDERPLLLSEVRVLAAVRQLDPAAALGAAIDERLMYQEASRLPQAQVTDEDEKRVTAALLEARPELARAVTPSELRRLLRRQAVILKYVEFRFRPQVRVGEDDVRAAYDRASSGREGAPDFGAEAPTLRAALEQQDLDRRIEAWVADLRARAEIRYVPEPIPGP